MLLRSPRALLLVCAVTTMPTTAGIALAAPPVGTSWRPVLAPPCYSGNSRRNAVACTDSTTTAPEVVVDPAGSRWLFRGKTVRRADTAMPPHTTEFYLDSRLGLLAIQDRRKIWQATDPLGPLVPLGLLPDGADPEAINIHAGALNVVGWQGPFWSTDGVTWSRLSLMGDRAASLAKIGADGAGLAIFIPQKIGTTRDGGRSWADLPTDRTLTNILMVLEDGTIALGSQLPDYSHNPEAGQKTLCWKAGLDRLQSCILPDEKDTPRRKAQPTDNIGRRDEYSMHTVVAGDTVISYTGGTPARVLRRKIGEGWTKSRLAQVCDGSESAQPHLTTCGGTLVVTCDHAIEIDHGGAKRTIKPTESMGGAALASPNQLWAVTNDGLLLSLDLRGQSFKRVALLPTGSSEGNRLVSACSPRTPRSPVYILNDESKSVAGSIDPSPSPVVRMFKSELPSIGDLALPSVDSQGRLVYLTDEPQARLARVSLDGSVEFVAVPPSVATKPSFRVFPGPQLLSSLRDGKALLVDTRARAFQTLDNGTQWRQVPGPFPSHGEGPHVLCGATRCEVDASVYREGWPTASQENITLDPGPSPRSGYRQGPRPSSLGSCKPVAPLGACAEIPVFARGLGSAVFSGICVEEVDRAKRRYSSFHGFADQHVLRRPLQVFDQATRAEEENLVASSSIAVEVESSARIPEKARPLPWLIDNGPNRPTVAAAERPAGVASLFEVEDGFVQLEQTPAQEGTALVWHHAGGAVERRSVGPVDDALHVLEREGIGTVIVDPRGDWVGAVLHFSQPSFVGALLIFRLPQHGEPTFRWLMAKAPQQLEWGLGLIIRDGVPHLATLEWTATDTTAARLRPIGADLDLGNAIDLEGGKAKVGHLIDPDPCPLDVGQQARMLTSSLHTYTISFRDYKHAGKDPDSATDYDLSGFVANGQIAGPVIRDLRIRGNTVCAERTAIGTNTLTWHERLRSAVMVGAGNGRSLAAVATDWITCNLAF